MQLDFKIVYLHDYIAIRCFTVTEGSSAFVNVGLETRDSHVPIGYDNLNIGCPSSQIYILSQA